MANPESSNGSVAVPPLVPRNYQSALIALAKERNIIACLPTGSGKTLIALKLSDEFFEPVKSKGLKIVFVAGTLPLLKQQFQLFQKYTVFQCTAFSGSGTEKFDTSSMAKFMEKYKSCEVLLMTPQYFYNLLTQGFILLDDICLLILDECHHAVKGDPMHQVMRQYSKIKEETPDHPLPRVLGLSATVVAKNVKSDLIAEAIASVEKRLDCIAVSYDMMHDVLEYSTNAQADCIRYTLSGPNLPGYNEDNFLAPISAAVSFFRSLPTEFKYDDQHKKTHPLVPNQWLFNGKALGDTLATILEECILLCPVLGPFGALHLSVIKIRHLKDKIRNTTESDGGVIKMYHVAVTSLMHFMIRVKVEIPEAFGSGNIEHLVSDKVLKVLGILMDYKCKDGTEDALCGLLFVSRRTIALVLKEVLLHLKMSDPSKYDFIRPAVVIGTNAKNKMSSKDRVKAGEQADIIKRFRNKELNLLICTSVLEEGLDVPSCNLVVRFDPVTSFASFIQSMGRARKNDARYLVLLHSDEYDAGCTLVRSFQRTNYSMNAKLREHLKDLMNGVSMNETDDMDDEEASDYIPDFCPNGQLGARVTAYTCVALCHRYANAILCNQVNCWNWYEKYSENELELSDGKKQYKASIMLPSGSAVQDLIVQGEFMPSKKLARKAACMEACKQIFVHGGFDKNFLPRVSQDQTSELANAIASLRL